MKTAVTVADVAIRSGHVIVQSTEPKHYQCEPTVATTIRALSAGQLGELIGAIANLNGAARVVSFTKAANAAKQSTRSTRPATTSRFPFRVTPRNARARARAIASTRIGNDTPAAKSQTLTPHARLIAFKRYGVRDDLFTRSMSGKAGYKTAPGYAGHDRQPWPRIDR
jgi:hypothetical protein